MDQHSDRDFDPIVENVTRDQEGQFIDEGFTTYRPDSEEAALGGESDVQMQNRDSSSVNALQVNMERSGADYVHAQKSFLTNSGAREIHSETARLTQSGVLTLHAQTAEFKQSSAVVANATTIHFNEGSALVATAEKMHIDNGGRFGMLTAGNVEANGDVKSFLMFTGNVKAGGNVTTTVNGATAGMAAAVFAIAMVLFSRLLGRKS